MNTNRIAHTVKMSNKTNQMFVYKKWLFIILAAAGLTVSACGKQDDEKPMEGSALEFDSETSEQEAIAEIEATNAPMISNREDNPVLPSSDEPEGTGSITGQQNEPAKDVTGGVGSSTNPNMPDNNNTGATDQ